MLVGQRLFLLHEALEEILGAAIESHGVVGAASRFLAGQEVLHLNDQVPTFIKSPDCPLGLKVAL